jgi:hypothetical protein
MRYSLIAGTIARLADQKMRAMIASEAKLFG